MFLTEECVHIVEATTSRGKDKAKRDLTKIAKLMRRFAGNDPTRAPRGWFVTREEPTADQRGLKEAKGTAINVLSFAQFQSRLVDSHGYLDARGNYAFGSVRDPETGGIQPAVEYVPLDIARSGSTKLVSHQDLTKMVSEGGGVVLLGDYGAGKSMTLRQVYRELRSSHVRGRSSRFPIYLNLRDHYGQEDPGEILGRHSRTIGFHPEHHLVRAWRAGYVHLLIDGFDEIAGISIQGEWRKLQSNRYEAMRAVRQLIREHPQSAGLLVAGRAHFFDSRQERMTALGLSSSGSVELSLNEFSSEQIQMYLQKAGLGGRLPDWLPSRPLLVGYLAAKGLLAEVLSQSEDFDQAPLGEQWDVLLEAIANREAEIESGIDGGTVRRILERLATKARAAQGGLGSLGSSVIVQAFSEVCGYMPGDRNMVLLQRLPGLGVDRQDEETRAFVDESFADACRAGDVVHFIGDPFNFPKDVLLRIEAPLLDVGMNVVLHRIGALGYSEGKLNAALDEARIANAEYMKVDLVRASSLADLAVTGDTWIGGAVVPRFEVHGSGDLSRVGFQDCFFSSLELDAEVDDSTLPSFQRCYIDRLEGRTSMDDLPQGRFDGECVIDRFEESADTTAGVLTLDLPLGVRVCITVLKKVYEQRGSGRQERALFRGLDNSARRLVPDVLHVLQSEGLLVPDKSRGQTIWRGISNCRTRVGQIVAAPFSPGARNDAVMRRCAAL